MHILALRVEFLEEDRDDFTSGGNGLFDMRTPAEAMTGGGDMPVFRFPYDLPPHDGQFLENHLQALANYVSVASRGEMAITWEIFPPDPSPAYNTGTYLAEYGSGADEQTKLEGWVRFLRDGLALAADDVGDLSRFQSFLVFNASVAVQGALSTELPPVALTPAEIARSGVSGVPAAVTSAWLMPQQIQEPGGVIGLNGAFAKTFLATRGLPVLSDTKTGGAAVGGWTLMDVGADNAIKRYRPGINPDSDTTYVLSFLPSLPMAWEQTRLGWLTPAEVRGDTTIPLAGLRVQSTSLPQAIRIPITDTEYYLVELRNSTWEDTRTHIGIDYSRDDTSGVWLRPENDDYDAYTPGSGVLVFHVDEDRIARWEPTNEINTRADRPGIYLVEADGYRDIGVTNYIGHPRAGEGTGSRNDPFPVSGTKTLYMDGDMAPGHPVSLANDGTRTGLELTFEPYQGATRDSVNVVVRWGGGAGLASMVSRYIGSPVVEGVALGTVGSEPGTEAIVVATEDGGVWAFDRTLTPIGSADGRIGTLGETPAFRPVIAENGDVFVYGATTAVQCRLHAGSWQSWGTTPGPPPENDIAGDMDRNGGSQPIHFTADGTLIAERTDLYGGGPRWIVGFPDSLAAPPSFGDIENDGYPDVFAVRKRSVEVISRAGTSTMTWRLGSADSTDAFRGSALTVQYGAIVPGRNSLYVFAGTEHPFAMRKITFPGEIMGTPALFENDGNVCAAAGLADGWFVARSVGSSDDVRVIWDQVRGDAGATGRLDESRLSAPTSMVDELMPKDRAFCYPSPVGNSTARLRFYLSERANVEASIYAAAGELVWTGSLAASETTSSAANELSWPGGTAFVSGLYICRIHASTQSGRSSNVVFPIGIAK